MIHSGLIIKKANKLVKRRSYISNCSNLLKIKIITKIIILSRIIHFKIFKVNNNFKIFEDISQ